MGLISYILRAISEFKTYDRREEGYYIIHKEKDDLWPTNVPGTDMSIDLGFTTSDRKCIACPTAVVIVLAQKYITMFVRTTRGILQDMTWMDEEPSALLCLDTPWVLMRLG